MVSLSRCCPDRAWKAAVLGGLLGLTGLVAGCGPANTYVEPPPPEVTVATPQTRDVTNYLEVTGTAQPVMTVDIRARVRGFLKERHFHEGSLVKKGDLLLIIDEEPFKLALDQAKARYAEANSALRKAKQSRAREVARAQLALDESSLMQAQSEERRQRKLIASRAVTEEDIERTEATRKKADAQVQSAKASLEQADADHETNILAAEANLAAALTAKRNAEIELSYCRMTAPIDGRISRVNHDLGNLVGDGQSSLLATIVKLDPVYVYTSLSEDDFLKLRGAKGYKPVIGPENPLQLDLELGNETDYPHRGHADYQDPAVDPDTGTVRMRGVFENPDHVILPGLFVRLRIPIDQQMGALVVPERALGIDQSGQYVLVVGPDDTVEYRPVHVGTRLGDMRVVEGKLAPQDRVVVEGLLRARPKMKVVAVPQSAPTAETADAKSLHP